MSGSSPQRGFSPVAGNKKRWLTRSRALIGIGLFTVTGLAWAYLTATTERERTTAEHLPTAQAVTVSYRQPELPPVGAAHVTRTDYTPPPDTKGPPPAPNLNLAQIVHPRPTPVMLSFADPPPRQKAPGADEKAESSHVQYAAANVAGVKAGLLGDQTLLLMPGLLICVMDTAVDSTFEGPVQCHLPGDVKPHGVTLLDRGSVVHGWYSNHVTTGQRRVSASIDFINDPVTGCFVKLNKDIITDALGRGGVPGSVDNHYLERFGAAGALTMVQLSESLLQAMIAKGGNTYLNFNSSGGADGLATEILQQQANIPPTISVNQGSVIAVNINEIIDFSGCYDVKLRSR